MKLTESKKASPITTFNISSIPWINRVGGRFALNEFAYILICNVLVLILAGFSKLPVPLSALRPIFGLPFVLFIPGYCFQAAAFPAKSDLEGKERLALSFALDLVLIPCLALVLDRTSWRITLFAVLLGLSGIVLLFSLIAVVRRNRLPENERFLPLQAMQPIAAWKALDHKFHIVYILLGIIVLLFGITAVSIIISPKPAEHMTEFFILGSSGKGENYPYLLQANQPAQIQVGIRNLEAVPTNYHIEVRDDRGVIGKAGPFALKVGETLQVPITFIPQTSGDNVEVTFLLFRSNEATPYRTLQLWVTVKADGR